MLDELWKSMWLLLLCPLFSPVLFPLGALFWFVEENELLTDETDGVSVGGRLFGVPDWLLDILVPFWTTPVLTERENH